MSQGMILEGLLLTVEITLFGVLLGLGLGLEIKYFFGSKLMVSISPTIKSSLTNE
jgi:ABC-type amino acid transport system permease subunit